MIGRITGTVLEIQPPYLLIDVHGLGYELHTPLSTFYQLAGLGTSVTLHTHLVVREDAHQLYGFVRIQERSLFRTLIKVSGVGPKLALTILSGMEPQVLVQTVQHNDTARLTQVPGVGKKTAERLILELKDKCTDLLGYDAHQLAPVCQATQDAVSALTALGYKANDAKKAVQQVAAPESSSADLIRAALKSISS